MLIVGLPTIQQPVPKLYHNALICQKCVDTLNKHKILSLAERLTDIDWLLSLLLFAKSSVYLTNSFLFFDDAESCFYISKWQAAGYVSCRQLMSILSHLKAGQKSNLPVFRLCVLSFALSQKENHSVTSLYNRVFLQSQQNKLWYGHDSMSFLFHILPVNHVKSIT